MVHPSIEVTQHNKIISRLYNNTTSRYLWLDKRQLTTQAHDALDFISAASNHGLRPDDYHYSTLHLLDPTQSENSAKQFDILLTDGLLQLIHDISNGRLDAIIADPDWFIPQTKINAGEFLQQALLTGHLRSRLNALIPTRTEYHALTSAIDRYQSYVDRGGWEQIPETQVLRSGDTHHNIPLIQARLAFEDESLTVKDTEKSKYFDTLMEQAVRRFQKKHSLKNDGIIGSETRYAMNISASERLRQIQINLERRRWMPKDLGQRYLFVNLANYKLSAIENGDTKLDMRIMIGRKTRPTPSFSSQVNHLVFNPYWNIPPNLAILDLLPQQQANTNYFYLKGIRVFSIDNGQKTEHDPYTIDWESVSDQNFPYILRQDPGEHNALGQLKFMFPNQWDIYLHDTAHKELFTESKRSLSSGCIRLEDPIALANFSLINNGSELSVMDMIASNENIGLVLTKSLPIYAVYFTVWLDDGEVIFSADVYDRDQHVAELL
ncbi:MAG: murein L,D-transpeptidase [Gammaproteobacteria bacterium]|nr:MAG: murein L,D-transpeptidase [Gammaproteobacteria bacterium]